MIIEECSHTFVQSVKKVQDNNSFQFKTEGLKEQFNLNNDRIDKLPDLEGLIECGNLEELSP